ncbi:MAG: CehA/McbA family metallohydrolase [Deltaproteobacteria bacterium]|nr:CehA/McbA family metallohydrolase [Deltaproteobacteria bacterium]
MRATIHALGLATVVASVLPACKRESCIGRGDSCELGPVCAELPVISRRPVEVKLHPPTLRTDAESDCDSPGFARVRRIDASDLLPAGPNALAAVGDVLIENGVARAVIDALDHPHHLAAHGGSLIDLELIGVAEDGLNVVLQATGLLPKDAVTYTSMRLVEGDGYAAIELRGHLGGDEEELVATRYEIRPCEPGIRVKTEIMNAGRDAEIWTISDGWFWGARSLEPFVPARGRGFAHPSFGLTDIDTVFTDSAFVAAAGEVPNSASYSVVACDRARISGFHSDKVTAAGSPRMIVQPDDRVVSERFIAVARGGQSVAPAVDLALEARHKLFGEATRRISGRLVHADGAPLSLVAGTVLISESGKAKLPWTHVLPDADGSFSVTVPAGRALVAEAEAFGRAVNQTPIAASADDVDIGALTLPAVSRVDVRVLIDGVETDAQVFVVALDAATEALGAKLFGSVSKRCSPLLGPPNGQSPACNRALVRGSTSLVMPPGRYRVYATGGIFTTLASEDLELGSGDMKSAELHLERLPIGRGYLSADFHVHGARSFDSSIPDRDRVQSFLAQDIDVLVATDHDVVTDYSSTLAALDGTDRIRVVSGVETTGLVLFDLVAGKTVPKVIGHYNFWPVAVDPAGAWRGSINDELIEPGVLFERFRSWKIGDAGVIQLNHPYAEAEFGRDLGFPKAIGLDARKPLSEPSEDKRQLVRIPAGASTSNLAYDTQEVMNGSDNSSLEAYRAYWFYLLNEGIAKAGTANSDSHGLADNVVGTPRTLVATRTTKARFDLDTFDEDVKAGRMIGTNGPVLEAVVASGTSSRAPSLVPFMPGPRAELHIRLVAAPWVPVDQIRVVVNGSVVKTLDAELSRPADPFGRGGLVRFEGQVPLESILPSSGDAWVVVEAGSAIPLSGDLDCDGIPDTSDNDENGVVDWRDADDNEEAPDDPCDGDTGPLALAPKASSPDEALAHFQAVTPGGYPFAFTNPFLIDRDGNGFRGADR